MPDPDVLDRALGFGAQVIEPSAAAWETGGLPREYFQRAAESGLCGLLVPSGAGGANLSVRHFAEVVTVLARHCMAATFALVVHNNLAAAIAAHAAPELRERFLPDMLAGRRIGAFLLTEAEVGSDAQAVRTSARREGGRWILSGSKAWITNSAEADTLCVFAQTELGSGGRGIAAFLVDAHLPGVRRLGSEEILGGNTLGAGRIAFEACAVAESSMLHPPGAAFRRALGGINLARIAVAGMCCGMLERALAEAIGYSRERAAFGQRIADFQGVQWILADAATDLEAARGLLAKAAAAADSDIDTTLPAAHAKKFATRIAFSRISDCMQLMGAAGLSRAYPLARHLAAAKIAQYLDGATEIQNVVIARALAEVYQKPARPDTRVQSSA